MSLDKYKDIINIIHHEPNTKHPRMTITQRAAQFAPFAALTGYEESIKEKGRSVLRIPTLTDDDISILNDKLNYLKENLDTKVSIEYFILDEFKEGCRLVQKEGKIKRIDEVNRFIKFEDNVIINLDNIINIYIINN